MIPLRVLNSSGELVGPILLPKLELSDSEWRQRLSPEQYRVLRSQGTERAFCGTLLDNKLDGVYTCAGCGLPLFSSAGKFNSGTGWPSFFQPIASENVTQREDDSHGMIRVEINCARCDGHLGHVFPDGPPPTRLRFCLNSESLKFTPSDQLASLAEINDESAGASTKSQTAVFGGGCFWCTEAAFEQLKGVCDVTSGYAGGAKETANYKQVCGGNTGHAEVIRVTYDPAQISYDQLLDVFFDAHDPTQLNRQGNDVGTQYRSAIFYADEQQKQAAETKIAALNQRKVFRRPIVTTLEPLEEFYPAEDYHQDYARLNPEQPYVQSHSLPKACQVRLKHAALVK
jgi:peptide methionine sulfoxide reductase msrA/msrB